MLSLLKDIIGLLIDSDNNENTKYGKYIAIFTTVGIIVWQIFEQVKMMYVTPEDTNWFIFMITMLIFMLIIVFGIAVTVVMLFKFKKMMPQSLFEEKTITMMTTINQITDALQQTNNKYDDLLKIVLNIQDTINDKNIPKIKNELENIHLRTQNIIVRCLKIIIAYHHEVEEMVADGTSRQIAKINALETANESFKEIKKYFIEDIYKSCLGLNEMIKLNILDLIENQNREMKKVLTDDKLTCEEKISTILFLNEQLCDSVYTTCRHNITIVEE